MMVSWDVNGRRFGELALIGLNGMPGLGFYRLLLRHDFTIYARAKQNEIRVNQLSGELWMSGKGGGECFLGYVRRQSRDVPITSFDTNYTGNFDLEIDLNAGNIEAIEQIRLGGGLKVRLNLYGAATCDQFNEYPISVGLYYDANQSTWINVLEGMGYRRTMLLEIPMFGDQKDPNLRQISEFLQKAQQYLLQGHFREAIGSCRDVLESLEHALGDKEQVDSIKFENLRQMDKINRLRLIRRALKKFTDSAKHPQPDKAVEQKTDSPQEPIEQVMPIDWNPEDARAIIIMTASLLQIVLQAK